MNHRDTEAQGKTESSLCLCVSVVSSWLLVVLALLYAAVAVPNFNVAYLDFGDGNYLYISRRLADGGVVLYRDILVPQPPCHLVVGSLLIRLGRLIGSSVEAELYTVRVFSLLLHLATMIIVWAIGRQLFRRSSTALWAAAFYLVIPVGFCWSLGYQSEPLEMFFVLSSFLLLIRWKRAAIVAAGLLAALGMATNMTAVPYVGWTVLFLLWHDRRRAAWYGGPAVGLALAVVGLGEWYSGGHYLENVFFNQVGTFPQPDLYGAVPPGAPFRTVRTILSYAFSKIASEGSQVLAVEGIFVSAAVAGLLFYVGRRVTDSSFILHPSSLRDSDPDQPPFHRPFVAWYAFWSLLSVCFVAKGATMEYIFTIGEPFVCLFAAYALTTAWDVADKAKGRSQKAEVRSQKSEVRSPESEVKSQKSKVKSLKSKVPAVAIAVLGLAVLFARPALWMREVLVEQMPHELDTADTEKVRSLIESHSTPDQAILAAPYYAFISRRKLIAEYSEFFIWDIMYLLEQRVERQAGKATGKIETIAEELRKKAIPVVVVNLVMRGDRREPMQVFASEPVSEALAANYKSLLPEPIRKSDRLVDVLVPR